MAFARTNGYVVLTHDLDFGAILAATRGDKPSVVQIRTDDVSPEAIGATVVRALEQLRLDIEDGSARDCRPEAHAANASCRCRR